MADTNWMVISSNHSCQQNENVVVAKQLDIVLHFNVIRTILTGKKSFNLSTPHSNALKPQLFTQLAISFECLSDYQHFVL